MDTKYQTTDFLASCATGLAEDLKYGVGSQETQPQSEAEKVEGIAEEMTHAAAALLCEVADFRGWTDEQIAQRVESLIPIIRRERDRAMMEYADSQFGMTI